MRVCKGLNVCRCFIVTITRQLSPVTAPPDEGTISPSELAILDSLIAGGAALSLKVSEYRDQCLVSRSVNIEIST